LAKIRKELQEEIDTYIVSSRVSASAGLEGPFRWHEVCEICQILEGSCSIVIDGKQIDGKKGDLFYIDSRLPHYYIRNTESIVRFLLISPKLFLKISKDYYPLKEYIPYQELHAVAGLEQALNPLLKLLDAEGRVYHEDPFVQSAATTIYFLLLRHFRAEQAPKSKHTKTRAEFFSTVEYINDHLTEPVTVCGNSKPCGITASASLSVGDIQASIGFSTLIRITEGKVEVPERSEGKLSARILVKIKAIPLRIKILYDFFQKIC